MNMRKTRWCFVLGVGVALLALHALLPLTVAQTPAKDAKDGKEKEAATGKTPEKEKIAFAFGKKPWGGKDGVLQWLAEQLKIPFVGDVYPQGSFTFIPPAGEKYTITQIIDFI